MEKKVFLKDLLIITVLAIVMLGIGTELIPLTAPDEGRNASAAWNMLSSGDFLTPVFNGIPRLIKPPLLYYLMLPFMILLGPCAAAARMPSVVAAVLMSLILCSFGSRYFGRKAGFWAALIWLTNIHVLLESRSAVPEMTLVLFQTLAFLFLIEGTGLTGKERSRGKVYTAWLCAGLAVLAKGPVGFLLPGLSAILCCLLVKGLKGMIPFLKAAWINMGPLLFLAIVLPWYLAMFHIHGHYFLEEFFFRNNLARFTGAVEYHPYSFWVVYLPVLLAAFWFWHPWWLPSIKCFFIKDNQEKDFLGAVFLYSIVVILFYALAANKLHHYLLASYPGLCLFLGYSISRGGRFSLLQSGVVAFQGFLELASGIYLFLAFSSSTELPFMAFASMFMVLGISTILLVLSRKEGTLWAYLGRGFLFLVILLSAAYSYGKVYAVDRAGYLMSGVPSALYREEQSALIFYSHKSLRVLKNPGQIEKFMEGKIIGRIYGSEKDLPEVFQPLEKEYRPRVIWKGMNDGHRSVIVELKREDLIDHVPSCK
ncbi:MAG: glycosyltransferase family 39 protein [Synergistales bacterium]|nr:glycosyltransferase family 39 protein [Synergistales bacterium]